MAIKDVVAAAARLSEEKAALDALRERKQRLQDGLAETTAAIPPQRAAVDAAKVVLQTAINELDLTQ